MVTSLVSLLLFNGPVTYRYRSQLTNNPMNNGTEIAAHQGAILVIRKRMVPSIMTINTSIIADSLLSRYSHLMNFFHSSIGITQLASISVFVAGLVILIIGKRGGINDRLVASNVACNAMQDHTRQTVFT